MFGVLKPALGHVSAECKTLYNSTYCNLCAALSASGAGAFNRFFLVNDVVTIEWLLTEPGQTRDHAFACYNCAKGGTLGKKNKLSNHHKFLAAVSSYVCGVKINDNLLDDPKFKNKSIALIYRPIMKKAEAMLLELNLLGTLQAYQKRDRHNEQHQVDSLSEACEPTEQCYELMTVENGKQISSLPQTLVALLGKYLGRCVYLLDAMEDMDEDKKKNQYNVLNLMPSMSKEQILGQCLDFMKPLRLEITSRLASLPTALNVETMKTKWDSITLTIDHQFFKLIKPFNCTDLLSNLASFSTLRNACSTCSPSSSWSSIKVIGICCPCCTCCPCCCC
ncbi:MAG: DUF5685 family protein [Legionellaceae bacterium]|nr:DUF5685 family protein [Legionellaceae bacterium]